MAKRPQREVADIFREYGPAYRLAHPLPPAHLQVMHAIEVCRTSYLGGHLEQCDSCDYQRPVYNSCRNRHCPKCQSLTKARWLAARQGELLPVGYFHSVFTLPHEINPLALANQKVVYDLLFRSVAETLQEFGADPKHGLGGKLGFTAILHTWNQKLLYHVHLHCLIAGGALSHDSDGQTWTGTRPNFLFPVKALSRVFRGKFIHYLQKAFLAGQLVFPGKAGSLGTQKGFSNLLKQLWSKEWVVYAKQPFAGPEQVLDYLGRYTHRVAIANHRLKQVEDGWVTFSYRDRRNGGKLKAMTLRAEEFIRRFLLHVVPGSYMRIRHFGFLANRNKERDLGRCRELLGVAHQLPESTPVSSANTKELMLQLTGLDLTKCPWCQMGTMVAVEQIPQFSPPGPGRRISDSKLLDSS